jgi:hypothetical protein
VLGPASSSTAKPLLLLPLAKPPLPFPLLVVVVVVGIWERLWLLGLLPWWLLLLLLLCRSSRRTSLFE